MKSAKSYAGVAVRKVWADLLLKLGLRERSAAAYDEALIRAAALSLDFDWQPVDSPVGFQCEHLNITSAGLTKATCWVGDCQVRPIFAGDRTSTR